MENTLKHFTPPTGRRTRQAILLSALLAAATGAHAAGTASDTLISNTATLTYSDGITTKTLAGSASFLVDNKVDVLVTGGDIVTAGVVPGAAVATTFTVTNQGNTTQDFKLNIVSAISGNQFDPTSCTVSNVAIATGTVGSYTVGDQHINALSADGVATVTVTCDIPNTVANGDDGLVALVATAKKADNGNLVGSDLTQTGAPTADVDFVFADVVAGTDDGARDAAHSARNTYTVTTAVLSVAKTVATVCDPFNGTSNPKNIPGAVARWTITITNTGSAAATLSQISDALNATADYTTFDPDLIDGTGGATACEYAAAGPGAPESGTAGLGVRIQSTNARPMAGSAGGLSVNSSYFTGDSDADGVTLSGTGLTAELGVDFATALPAGGTYGAGELKKDEIVTVYFNVGINN